MPGKNRRLTFFECNNDLNSMMDIAKIADLVCRRSIDEYCVCPAVVLTMGRCC